MHGVQIWLALTDEHEDDPPSFEHHPEATMPVIRPAPGARGRVLIGGAFGVRSPIRHPSQPLLVDLELDAGASLAWPGDEIERALFVIEGELDVGGTALTVDRLAVSCRDKPVQISAQTRSRVLLLGGPPVGTRFIEWNFVASTRERITRARDAWKARQFPTIPNDDQEFIPWPG
jgi:redox-sensitive bicupin YhaK (pirin superfamily)